MISLVLIILAAICNATMDRLENEPAYNKSIFRNLNPKWWLKTESWKWKNFLPLTRYRLDGWHMSKSAMICLMVAAILLYTPLLGKWDFFVFGVAWNLTFTLFYHNVFKIKDEPRSSV